MTTQVPVRLTDADLAALDAIVASGRYANRSAVLRAGLDRLVHEAGESTIEQAYLRGYGETPQEEWAATAGLAAFAAFDTAEDGPPPL